MQQRRFPLLVGLLALALSSPLAGRALADPPSAHFDNGQDAFLVLGQPDFNASDSGPTDSYDRPYDIAVDEVNRKVYVLDTVKNRIFRHSLDDILNGVADNVEMVFGQPDLTSTSNNAGGSVGANTLYQPNGAVVDSAGRLWVADSGNDRVLRFDSPWNAATFASADGVLGQDSLTGTASDGLTRNRFKRPDDVAISADGTLYVTDSISSRVLRWDNAAAAADGADADGVLGQPDFVTDLSGAGPAELSDVESLAIDPTTGALFVGDRGNQRVLRWDDPANAANGAAADGILGQLDLNAGDYDSDTTDRLIEEPSALVVDSSGRLYLAEYANNRVVYWNDAANREDGAPMDGVLGQPDFFTSDSDFGGADPNYGLEEPEGIAVGPDTLLLVADYGNNRIMIWQGEPILYATPSSGPHCDDMVDVAVSPQYITLQPGGSADVQVTVRNTGSRDHGYADLLVSLSDGLSVAGASQNAVNLGQRVAWQQLMLTPNETRSFTLTVTAAEAISAPMQHVTEWYCRGNVQHLIDGVFLTPAQAAELSGTPLPVPVAAAPALPAAPAVVVTPEPVAALPVALPNTGAPAVGLIGLAAAALGLALSGLRLRRR
jgi:sugar lactone lactonase YvrE